MKLERNNHNKNLEVLRTQEDECNRDKNLNLSLSYVTYLFSENENKTTKNLQKKQISNGGSCPHLVTFKIS